MNILDGLFVEIGLDPTDFEEKAKTSLTAVEALKGKALRDTSRVGEETGKQVSHAFRTVERHFIAFFGALLGARGIGDFVQSVTRAEVGLGVLAASLGLSVQNLSAFQLAVQRVGGSVDAVSASLANFNRMVIAFNLEGQPAPSAFYRLGGGFIDPNADRITQLRDFGRRVAAWQGTEAQKRYLLGQLGFDDFTQSLLLDPAKMNSLLADTRADATTPEQAKSGQQLNQAFQAASQTVQAVGREMVRAVAGPMGALLNDFTAWVDANRSWMTTWFAQKAEAFRQWVDGLDWQKIGTTVGQFVSTLQSIVAAVGGWKTVVAGVVAGWLLLKAAPILTVGAALLTLAAPLGNVVVALAAVLAGYKLVQGLSAAPSRSSERPRTPSETADASRPSPSAPPAHEPPTRPRTPEEAVDAARPPPPPARAEQDQRQVELQTSEGEVSEGRPVPVRIVGAQEEDDDSFLGLIGRALGKATDWFMRGFGGKSYSGGGAHSFEGQSFIPGSGSAAGSSKDMDERAMRLMDDLVNKHGWTPEAAAIAAGNAQQESGVRPDGPMGDPNTVGDGQRGSWGMFQWNRHRLTLLKQYAASLGKSWQDWDVQVNFFDQEARGMIPTWPSQRSLGGAGSISHTFEGYGDDSTGTRIANAARFYRLYGKRPPPPKPMPSPAADKAASDAKTSMLNVQRNYNVARIDVHARSTHAPTVAREVREALQRELANVRVA